MKFIKDPSGLKIWFEKIGEKTWVHFKEHTFVFKEKSKSFHKKQEQASFSPLLKAPFPGRVLSIKIQEKDVISADQHLIVMESMKIEHTLSVPYTAKIKTLCIKEGESVEINHTLLQLEEIK